MLEDRGTVDADAFTKGPPMPPRLGLFVLIVASLTAGGRADAAAPDFVVEPYVQRGDAPSPTPLALRWHAEDVDAAWSVAYQTAGATGWAEARPTYRREEPSKIDGPPANL